MANLTRHRPLRRNPVATGYGDFLIPFESPFGALQRLQQDVGRFAEGFWQGSPEEPLVWQPAVDIYEEGKQWVVKADIPGVEPKDIDVQVTDDGLKIAAETVSEEKTEDKGYYRSERRFGAFRRFIPLPAEVDPERVKANFRNGVLEVRMPKSESSTRRIPVQASEGDGGSIRTGRS